MSFNNEGENQDKWQNDPDNWIWGIFYYNPEDSRLFPPKRIRQLGWTINFANPNSVFLVIVLIAIAFIFS
ncbi:MAG TPA: DUF5808 domain-containing protein [Flavobacterium sp.]|nr:DUF5808 domain-containing protein [Flavobacterium sp.]